MAGVWRLPPGKSGRKHVNPWEFLKTTGKFTTLQFEEVNGWSVGQVFLLEPREKSHGQVDEATLPLCVMHLRKRERNISFVCQVLEIHLQESPRLDLKNRLPPIPKGSKAGTGEFPSKRLCDLGSSPIHLGSCNFGERISGNPRCFFGVLLCDGTWNACQKA